MDPRQEYERRLAASRERIAALDRVNLLISNGRLAIAAAGALLLWMAFIRASISPLWPMAAALGFGALAVIHARRLNLFDRALRVEQLYRRGLDRLDDKWAAAGRDGAAFGDGHPYAGDLDLFGPGSLFERLNSARTEAGEATLADWLREPAAVDEIRARQEAVAELRPRLEFREHVAVLASESPIGRTGALATWAAAARTRFPPALAVWLATCAAITVALAALTFAAVILPDVVIGWIILQTAIAAIWRAKFHHVLHAIDTPERDLGLIVELLARIETERFSSRRLVALQQALTAGGVPASTRIARLRGIVSWLDSTHNILFGPIAYVLLLRQQLAIAIDRWHAAHGPAIAGWLRAIGDAEALSALATFAFERPADPFPEIVDEGPVYEAEGLAHPLIPSAAAIRNDIHLGAANAHVVILSGSNMSGKSTFLRTIGVNVVLALAGGPVTATRLRLSPLVLGATLHVEDSLQAGRSRFYAEILRIRAIVEAARGPVPLLFLLDEILHGTNSFDRRIGAEGIVRALAAAGAIGVVTTHDLALTDLVQTLNGAVNMHFEDRLEGGTMTFDYRLREGVVEHSNALALMRAIGLDV